MINITRLLTDQPNAGDHLRYASNLNRRHTDNAGRPGPVLVWNITRACNLNCLHCYAEAGVAPAGDELSTREAEELINDLAAFKVPVLLFSGGEPMLRRDILHLIKFAAMKGIRPVISTNGTLLTESVIHGIKQAGAEYVGISLDGLGKRNDRFRGQQGAYKKAVTGIANCLDLDQKVGLRFTINKENYGDLAAIFDLVEQKRIPRVCFYHLVCTGRGTSLRNQDITPEQRRNALDLIIDTTRKLHDKGFSPEILTVDNHADGIYLYLKEKKRNPARAAIILQLLKNNGGNRSGIAFGNIDWRGEVHPDQFTREISFGNIRERKFSEIWSDLSNSTMIGFKERKGLLKGRCRRCAWLDLCNGNLRARALNLTGDLWAADPGCYLSNKEIGLGMMA